MTFKDPETPLVAADVICYHAASGKIAVIERKFPPLGLALPGGFVNRGEPVDEAARREIKEELNVDLKTLQFLGYYDNPTRDPRRHVISFAFVGVITEIPVAGDDAKSVKLVLPDVALVNETFCFDHAYIIRDAKLRGMI